MGGIRVVDSWKFEGGFERMVGALEEIVVVEGCVGRVGGVLEDG